MATAEDYAAKLKEQDIDPEYFLSHAVPAAEKAGGGLKELFDLTITSNAGETGTWTPLYFCVPPISERCVGDADAFRSMVVDLRELVAALHNSGSSTVAALQRGVPTVAQSTKYSWVVRESLKKALFLAKRGIGPGELLTHVVPVVDEMAAGDEANFVRILDALVEFSRLLDQHGMGPYYPMSLGVAQVARVYVGDPDTFLVSLKELGALAVSMKIADISPYGVFEYAVTSAFQQPPHWILPEILPLASALAVNGADPFVTLQSGYYSFSMLGEQRYRQAIDLAHRVAAHGVDPGLFLQYVLPQLADHADLDALLEQSGDLMEAMHEHGIKPLLTFQYGLPQAAFTPQVGDILDIAIRMARQGTNPGPALNHGLCPLVAEFQERPEPLRKIIDSSRALVDEGVSPWRFLDSGVPGVMRVAKKDDALFLRLVDRLEEQVLSFHRRGIDLDHLLMYGVHPLARNTEDDPELFETFLTRLEKLAAALQDRGIDPGPSISNGIPEIAQVSKGVPWVVEAVLEFCSAFDGDPAPVLKKGIPALVQLAGDRREVLLDLLDEVTTTWREVRDPAESMEEGLHSVAAAADGEASPVKSALAFARRLAGRNVDPSPAFFHGVASVIQHCGPDALEDVETFLVEAGERGPLVAKYELHLLAELAGNRESFSNLLGGFLKLLDFENESIHEWGSRAARRAAEGGVEEFLALYRQLVERADRPELEHALRKGYPLLTHGRFTKIVDRLCRLEDVFLEHAPSLISAAAQGDAEKVLAGVDAVLGIQDSGALKGHEEEALTTAAGLIRLVHQSPDIWDDLIVPTLRAHGAGSAIVLHSFRPMERALEDKASTRVLREIITQFGVRVPEILIGLVQPLLRNRMIPSLAEERDLLMEFLRRVSFCDPEYYSAYREVMSDESTPLPDRRKKVGELHRDLREMMKAVREARVTEEHEKHPLFAQVLYHVFPPAVSAGRRSYREIYRTHADHPEHLEGKPLTSHVIRLAQGAYFLRSGVEVDVAAWEPVREAVAAVHASPGAEDPEKLGRDLFRAWIEGGIGKEKTRSTMLQRIYRVHLPAQSELPESLDDPMVLLKYREFLADSAKEIIQDGLRRVRLSDPERYETQVKARLSPRREMGRGLMRSVSGTVKALREGKIDRETAVSRLGRQLKGFDLSDPESLLQSTDLDSALAELQPEDPDVRVGEEHLRVLQDLAGPQLASMQRELFGDGEDRGKLEYRREAGGPEMEIRFEVTKRKAHAAVGYCEGVCTASDVELWDRPEFFQVVFWGPEGHAVGGMHLLIVEEEGRKFLSLPGINPSLALLKQVGADAILDPVFDFTRKLAASWGLEEIWIPTQEGIYTNRGPVRQAIHAMALEKKAVQDHTFSYRPYAYRFNSVWVVPST